MARHSSRQQLGKPVLFAAALLVAIGGLIYELILGTAASYLFGDSITAFSLATGLSLFGMGIGSLVAYKFAKRPASAFVANELLLAFIGGNSVLALFAAFSLTNLAWLVFVVLSIIIGIAIGMEIPLMVSLVRIHGRSQSIKLFSRILALDYFGALIASLLFPFLLLPYLGLMRTAYAVAILNTVIALFIMWQLGLRKVHRALSILAVGVVGVLAGFFGYATSIEAQINAAAYRDPVVYQQFTPYQNIVMTTYKHDTQLYLNNQLQFSTLDEARYHETLAHTVGTSSRHLGSVLIIGGGDGLLAREFLKYPDIKSIYIVDIDPAMTDLARSQPLLSSINQHALTNPKVTVINQDGFTFVDKDTHTYDAIIVDLVDPSNEKIAKLYSKEFYQLLTRRIKDGGIYATQATSTYFTPHAFSTIVQTMQSAAKDRKVVPFGVNVPSFGEWGFVASMPKSTVPLVSRSIPKNVSYVNTKQLERSLDVAPLDTSSADASTLLRPIVYQRYNDDMKQWRY